MREMPVSCILQPDRLNPVTLELNSGKASVRVDCDHLPSCPFTRFTALSFRINCTRSPTQSSKAIFTIDLSLCRSPLSKVPDEFSSALILKREHILSLIGLDDPTGTMPGDAVIQR